MEEKVPKPLESSQMDHDDDHCLLLVDDMPLEIYLMYSR